MMLALIPYDDEEPYSTKLIIQNMHTAIQKVEYRVTFNIGRAL